MAGFLFDAWQVGEIIAHEICRTATDNLLFSTITHKPQPLHIDHEAAKASELGREVMALNESRSRPCAGIVTLEQRAIKQRDEVVCQCLRSAQITRGSA